MIVSVVRAYNAEIFAQAHFGKVLKQKAESDREMRRMVVKSPTVSSSFLTALLPQAVNLIDCFMICDRALHLVSQKYQGLPRFFLENI